ncbi:hypothetical protein EZS27_027054 [termite gut metagenome]|uniref:Uncharacterized protein n=1 Tax=termite gut metagenome TaxID=433724 RepID=A0A5J4QSG9_9ZZZZ
MSKKIKNSGNDISTNGRKYIKTEFEKEEFEKEGDDKLIFVSIKNLQESFECFSDWNKKEMKKFWDFNRGIHKIRWDDLHKSGGKEKTGWGYTLIPRDKYKRISFFETISKDKNIFELRVDNKMRVHGFREKSVFYLCVLDREHRIC